MWFMFDNQQLRPNFTLLNIGLTTFGRAPGSTVWTLPGSSRDSFIEADEIRCITPITGSLIQNNIVNDVNLGWPKQLSYRTGAPHCAQWLWVKYSLCHQQQSDFWQKTKQWECYSRDINNKKPWSNPPKKDSRSGFSTSNTALDQPSEIPGLFTTSQTHQHQFYGFLGLKDHHLENNHILEQPNTSPPHPGFHMFHYFHPGFHEINMFP